MHVTIKRVDHLIWCHAMHPWTGNKSGKHHQTDQSWQDGFSYVLYSRPEAGQGLCHSGSCSLAHKQYFHYFMPTNAWRGDRQKVNVELQLLFSNTGFKLKG